MAGRFEERLSEIEWLRETIVAFRTDVAELWGMCEELARQREALSQRRELMELLHQMPGLNS